MATAPNTQNNRLPTRPKADREELFADNISRNNTAKQTYTGITYGNDHGSISFGHIHKKGDVISDVMIRASDVRQSIVLDKDGPRRGSTQITAPGRISIESGIDKQEAEDTLFIHSWNGNINIVASNGKIRMQGTDIELIAVGEGGSKGNIRINASQGIALDAKQITATAKSIMKLSSPGSVEVIANGVMTLYGSMIRGVSDAVAIKNDKNNNRRTQQKLSK
jgi:hypothetical protein